ncbi:MAG: hypothetical protein ABR988_03615 [Terriglobales bacterium]|jgi:hypothetical protein
MADLLEVRYGLLAIEAIGRELTKLTGSADVIGPQFYAIANVFLPNWDELHSRYDLAVSAIAGFNPVLGFRLRSKDIARPLFATLSKLAAEDQQTATVFPAVAQAIGTPVKAGLERAILAIAWKHGIWTWIEAKKQIRIKVELPADLMTKLFPPALLAAARAAGSPQTVPDARAPLPKSGAVNSRPGQ